MHMVDEMKLDQYMICLEVVDYYPDANIIFWLDYLKKHVQGKVHILSYRAIKQEIQKKYTSNKFVWIFGMVKSYEVIGKYIEEQNKEDAVVIVGGERLASCCDEKAISSLKIEDKYSNLHLQEDEDWTDFSKNIDKLYGKYQSDISGLVLICNVNNNIADRINKELETSNNMSITRTEILGCNCESSDNATKVLREIKGKSLKEALEIIKKNATTMDSEHIIMCQAIAYHGNGDITKTIELLKSIYKTLSNEQKLFLAEMYILQNLKEEAKKIFEEVYSEDRWERGLFELGLNVYKKDEKRYRDILEEGIIYQPENTFLIERYANFLVDQGNHKEAASWFRKIDKPYFELIARINDLLAEEQTDIKIVKSYIFEIVEKNPDLKNIALLKVALYAKSKGHYYNAYNLLREADLHEVDDTTQDILEHKIDILKDTERACKALGKLKPFRKEKDYAILLEKRCSLLLECINFFANIENGYYHWRKLLECQQVDIWNISLKKRVLGCIKELGKIDFDRMLPDSYISNLQLSEEHLNCDTAIICLRKSNCGEMPPEKFGCTREELVKGSWVLIEAEGTTIQRIWLRYYCSIGASVLSENPQEATSFSLSILEYGKTVDSSEQKLLVALYLMAWANVQFRLGNTIEGVACAIVSIKQLLVLKEVTPVLEEGLNILSKYLGMYDELYSENEKNDVVESIEVLKKYNESLEPLHYKYSDDVTEIIQNYEERVENCEEKDSHWLIDLSNLIAGKVKNKEYDKAVKYITDNYNSIHGLLNQRRDIAAKLYYSWGDLLIKTGGSIENVLLGLEMLDNAIIQLQKRRQVYHQEERAALAQEYDQIIREYLCFSGIYYAAKDIEEETKRKLRKEILEKMSICLPLSVIEQKNYYLKNEISDELDKKHCRLQQLKREYAIMLKGNRVEDNDVQTIAREIEFLSKELINKHPYYMPLNKFEGTNWEELKKNLKPDEVVYQYVLTEMAMVSILVTDKWIDIRTKFFSAEGDTPYSGMKKYGQIIESNTSSDGEIKYFSSVITDVVAEHLCEYVFNHKTKSIYVIPDISKSIFPIAAVQYKGIYLIDEVEEIVNFIDYVQLINSLNTELDDIKIVNKVFGKREETSIHHINKWLEEHIMDNVVSITDCSDDLQAVSMECKKGKNTLIVYGHGVREPASELTEGAQSIEGAKSMIQIREVLKEVCISNFILISCVGGTPNSNNPEISSGTWTSIFERFNGNIMTCRWSVPTRDTISMMDKIYDNLLNKKMRFGEALVKAQRDMKNSGKNQLSWAGIECWIN